MTTRPTQRSRGFTLIESLIVLAVAAVTVGSVAPGFQRAVETRRLEGVAAQLETELQFARSLAVTRNQSVRFSFGSGGQAGSCYVIHTGAAGACQCTTGAPVCSAGAEALRTHAFDSDRGMRASSTSASFLFDPTRGTVTPTSTIELRSGERDALRLVVNITGRVRACSPSGLAGYRTC